MGAAGGREYPAGMHWRPATLILAAIIVTTSCSGDDDTAATTVPPTTSAASTTAEGTTAEATTTAAPSTTEAPTTDPTTSPPPTNSDGTTTEPTTRPTEPPTSSDIDDFARQAAEIIERTEASWDVVLAAFQDPFDEDKAAALDEYFTGNQLEGFNNLLDVYRRDGVRAVQREGISDTYEADPRSLALDLEGGRASLQVCHVETSLVVETGGNPDGTDRVISDDLEEQIVELDVIRVDGTWKVSRARSPETEIASCS